MGRIIQSTIAGLITNTPNTSIRRTVEGATKVPAVASSDASVLLMPIIAPKGKTDELVTFDGQYSEFVAEYGDYDLTKHGMPFKAVHDHILAGGRWVGMNMRADDATAANVVMCMVSTPITKTFFVDAEGTIYLTQPVSTPTKEVPLNTYNLSVSYQNFPGIKKLTELDLATKAITVMSSPNNMVMPFLSLMYGGRGKYGNNIELVIDKTTQILKTSIGKYCVYNLAIMDTNDSIILEKHPFTHARDIFDGNGMAMNIGDGLDDYGKVLKHRQYGDNIDRFDTVFETMLTDILIQIEALKDDATTPMPELEKIYTTLSDIRTIYVNNDNNIPAFNLIDPFGALPVLDGEDENIFSCIFSLPADKITQVKLTGGDDGYLKKLKRFDWDFEAEVDGVNTKALESLYRRFFNGTLSSDIYDRNRNRSDYILDPDFPMSVKLAADALCSDSNRLDIQFLEAAPISILTVDGLKSVESFHTADNINRTKFANSLEMRDAATNKWVRTTTPIALLPELTKFYKEAIRPIAGRYLKGIKERSVLPMMNSLKDLDWCFENDWNYITEINGDYMMDGNAGAYKGYDHPAKELYNQLWSGRLIKDMLDFLDRNRHRLQSEPLSVIVKEVEETVLKSYRNIGLKCTYTIGYSDERARKAGTLTDELQVEGPRTNKRHNLLYRLTNNN